MLRSNEGLKTLPRRTFISVGSNIEPEKNLPLGIKSLGRLGNVVAVSGVYQNPPVGSRDQPDFLNAAILLLTSSQALALRGQLRAIEAELGRFRTEDKFAPRTLDLDLCLFENLIIQTPEISIPDPDILQRAHLAVPLADLDPEFRHPLTGETLESIAARLKPAGELRPRKDIERVLESLFG